MRTRKKKQLVKGFGLNENQLLIREYAETKHGDYKIIVYATPFDSRITDSFSFFGMNDLKCIIDIYSGRYCKLYKKETSELIWSGVINLEPMVRLMRALNPKCACVCEFCFWRGILDGEKTFKYNKEEARNEYICYKPQEMKDEL